MLPKSTSLFRDLRRRRGIGDLGKQCTTTISTLFLLVMIMTQCLDYAGASWSRNGTINQVLSDYNVTSSVLMTSDNFEPGSTTPLPDMVAQESSIQIKKRITLARPHLPECAAQQVCNSMFVNANLTRQLCSCHGDYPTPCSTRMDPFDGHSLELTTTENRKVYTLLKLCEPSTRVRMCGSPRDWTLLALQSVRTGKAHYVVVCRCPKSGILEGPILHDNPPYARVPGIRVYGMLCSFEKRNRRHKIQDYPEPPWDYIYMLLQQIRF